MQARSGVDPHTKTFAFIQQLQDQARGRLDVARAAVAAESTGPNIAALRPRATLVHKFRTC